MQNKVCKFLDTVCLFLHYFNFCPSQGMNSAILSGWISLEMGTIRVTTTRADSLTSWT